MSARRRRKITAIVAAVLVVFAGTVTVQSLRIAREAEAAAEAAARAAVAGQTAQQVTDFLVKLFEEADPYATQGRDVTARALLERGKARIEELAAEPEVQAALMHVMGVVYGNLGLYQESAALLERAVERRRGIFGDRHPAVAESLHALARTLENQQAYEPAERSAREALALRRALLGDAHPHTADAMETLGDVFVALGKHEEAEPLYREVLAVRRQHFGTEHPSVAQALLRIGTQQLSAGASREATRWFRDALDMYQRLAGDHQLDIAMTTYLLGSAYLRQEDLAAATALLQESLATHRKLLSDEHPRVAATMRELALVYRRTGQHQQAEALGRDLLASYRASMGETSPGYAATMADQAGLARIRGACKEADALSRQALSILQTVFPDDHDLVAEHLNGRGLLLESWGDVAAAERHYRDSLEMFQRLSSKREMPATFVVMANLASLHVTTGDLARAKPLLEQALAALQQAPAAGAWRLEHVNSVRGLYLARAGDPAAGERLLLSSYRWLDQHHGAHRMYTQRALARIAIFHELRGEPDKAREYSARLDQVACSSPP